MKSIAKEQEEGEKKRGERTILLRKDIIVPKMKRKFGFQKS
jgi:hypothetical protein